MRRLFHALTVVLVTIGVVGFAAPAQAAAKPGVTISKSSVTKPAYGASTVITPKYKKGPRTKIVSAKLTVRGKTTTGRTVNTTSTSVRVTAGTYKVTTKVVFKTKKTKKAKKWSGKKTKKRSFTHVVGQGAKNCATTADYDAVKVGTDYTFGSFKPDVEKLMAHVGRSDGAVVLEDMFWIFYDEGDYDTAAFVLDLQEVYGDYASLELVTYNMCASTKKVEILYVNYVYQDRYFQEVLDKEIV